MSLFKGLAMGAAACLMAAAHAEQNDRNQPTYWEAERASHDELRQVTIAEGVDHEVTITRGSFVLRAWRVEIRQDAQGYQSGIATGNARSPASFRQKRDGLDQYFAGHAARIDYDQRTDQVTLTGNARLQRLEGATVADEVVGDVIVYDSRAERYTVSGGGNNSGRVRGVIAPRAPAPQPSTTPPSLRPAGPDAAPRG